MILWRLVPILESFTVWHLETLQYFSLKYDFHFSQHLFSYLLAPFIMFNLEKSPKALHEILEI